MVRVDMRPSFATTGFAQQSTCCYVQQRRSRRRHCSPPSAQAKQHSPAVEFVPYTIISRQQSYDLRFLDAYTVVRMPYGRRDEGYLGLGAYFDGENDLEVKLAETQPVVMRFAPRVCRLSPS